MQGLQCQRKQRWKHLGSLSWGDEKQPKRAKDFPKPRTPAANEVNLNRPHLALWRQFRIETVG